MRRLVAAASPPLAERMLPRLTEVLAFGLHMRKAGYRESTVRSCVKSLETIRQIHIQGVCWMRETKMKSTERELKLVFPKVLTEADVARMLETVKLSVKWLSTVRQMDTYFDTREGILLSAGSAFRVRRIVNVNIGTFKLPISIEGALHERQEIEWQIDSNEDHSSAEPSSNLLLIPSDVRLALAHLGVRAAAPVLIVMTTRHSGEATDERGFVAEVALDEVTFIGPRGEARQCEVELEYRTGNTAWVKQIEESLIEQHGFEPSRSKFSVRMGKVG